MKKLFFSLAAFFFCFSPLLFSQQFQKTYGGTQDDRAYSVIQTTDGGYIASGNTGSSASTQYLHVVKMDNAFNVQWTFRINASSPNQTGRSIIQTADGGYVVAGNNNGIGGSAGTRDYYILKLDNSGSLLWTRVLDQNGAGNNSAFTIAEIPSNGGFILSGTTDASCNTGNIALVKLTSDGTYNWKQNYGACAGSGDSWPARVVIANDGGFVVAGTSNSGSNGGGNLYLLKTNSAGTIQWGKTVGGSSYLDQGFALTKSNDGGFAVAGYTKSYPTAHAGVGKNVYVVKFDSGGTLQWTRTVGGTSGSGSGDNIANSIVQTSGDDGYLVAGSTSFYGTGGGIDGYAAKLTSAGTLSWTKTFGGSSTDEIQSVIQNSSGDFVMAGLSASYGNPAAQFDWYLLTMASDGTICGSNTSSGGFAGSGGSTGTDTNNPTTSLTDRGASGTVTTYTGTVTSIFSSPTPSISGPTTLCSGSSATLTASGGSTYSWNTGATTTTITVAPTVSTVYSVIASNSFGCTAAATKTITVNSLFAEITDGSQVSCAGGSNGSLTVSVAGGTTPYTYLWNSSPSQTTAVVTNLTVGTYLVTVTDANGCTSSSSQELTVRPLTPVVITSTGLTTNCTDSTYQAILTASAGISYLWSNAATTRSITVTSQGNYSVTVTDASGCTGNSSSIAVLR